MVRPGFTVKGQDGVIEALLPLDRLQIENDLGAPRFIHNFGYRSGPKFERLKDALIVFIRKHSACVAKLPKPLECKCLAMVYREVSRALRYTSVCALKEVLLGYKAP